MTHEQSLTGVVSLLLTPFREDKSIDWSAYDRYVEWQAAAGANGLFAVCGTSEMKWLTRAERLDLARRAVLQAGGLPVVATGNLDPDQTQHASEIAELAETGVAGVVLVPPHGMGVQPGRLEDYLGTLALQAPCPIYLYEWPESIPCHVSGESFGTLSRKFGVRGIKDTTCTLEGIGAKLREAADDAVVFQANTPYLLDSVRMGAKGVMAITSGAAPDIVVNFWRAANRGSDEAVDLHSTLVFLDSLLRLGYPQTAKYLLKLRGLPFETQTRWPVSLPAEARRAMEVFYESVFKR